MVGRRTLPTHAAVDFEMNRQIFGRRSCDVRRGFETCEVERLPDDGRQVVPDQLGVLPGKDSPHDEDPGLGTKAACRYAFFYAGNAQPLSSRPDGSRSAELQRVAV